MALRKQEFYEGAALHALVRTGLITGIRPVQPFLLLNERVSVLLKYSTRGRSPWGFTFAADEQQVLRLQAAQQRLIIGLICGSDGVAAFDYDAYSAVAPIKDASIHIACYRDHGEHYEVRGPDGALPRKVAPSAWTRILEPEFHP
jgi:hypothetical protein